MFPVESLTLYSPNADHQPVVAVTDLCDDGPTTTRLHGVVMRLAIDSPDVILTEQRGPRKRGTGSP